MSWIDSTPKQMAIPPKPTNALYAFKMIASTAKYPSKEECISRIRVRKDCFKDFAKAVWESIDFHDTFFFAHIPPDVVSEYGHHIQRVSHVRFVKDLQWLQNKSIAQLKQLDVKIDDNEKSLRLFLDSVERNRGSLSILGVTGALLESPMYNSEPQNRIYLLLDAHSAKFQLTVLQLESLYMTREAFSSVLQSSPRLQSLTLRNISISGFHAIERLCFRDGLKTMVASVLQVTVHLNGNFPFLLFFSFFPTLELWRVPYLRPELDFSSMFDPVPTIPLAITCPMLKDIIFEGTNNTQITNCLDRILRKLQSLTLCYGDFDWLVMNSLFWHRTTITTIVLRSSHTPVTLNSWDQRVSIRELVIGILWFFPCLAVFSAEEHTICGPMLVGKQLDCCNTLRELRVRFRCLRDEDEVNKCLELLSAARGVTVGNQEIVEFGENVSAAAEETFHLLVQFRNLRKLWLGTHDHHFGGQ